jgi:hypothetical protein
MRWRPGVNVMSVDHSGTPGPPPPTTTQCPAVSAVLASISQAVQMKLLFGPGPCRYSSWPTARFGYSWGFSTLLRPSGGLTVSPWTLSPS